MSERPWRRELPAGDSGLLLDFGDVVSEEVNILVHATNHAVNQAKIPGVTGTIPAFSSLLIEYDPLIASLSSLVESCSQLTISSQIIDSGRVIDVPVWYGGDAGPDLSFAAQVLKISPEEIIELHTSMPYRIYCMGFSAGFPLAGLLPRRLVLARRSIPRTMVPAGSVAMAGVQTGIYPIASPGGWHILGRTPISLLNWNASPPVAYQPGDKIAFYPITEEAYRQGREAYDGHFVSS